MQDHANLLSLEQEFHLRQLSDQVQGLSRENMQELVLELSRQIMVKDNLYKDMLKWQLSLG